MFNSFKPHAQKILPILIFMGGCQDWTIHSCITGDRLMEKYGWIVELVIEGQLSTQQIGLQEIIEIDYQQKTLPEESRRKGLESGHLQPPRHRPMYGDEFVYAVEGRTLYEFSRFELGSRRSALSAEGPGERLYRTGIMRGYAIYSEGKLEVLDYLKYREVSSDTYERIRIRFLYPALLSSLSCG